MGYHEVLHLFDMAGTVAFFLFIARHVVTHDPPAAEEPESGAGRPGAHAPGYALPPLRGSGGRVVS